MSAGIEREYETRRAAASAAYAHATVHARRLLWVVLGALAAAAVLGIKAFYGWLPASWVLVPVAVIAAVEPLRHRAMQAWVHAVRIVHFYEDGLARLHRTGAEMRAQPAQTVAEFSPPSGLSAVFAADLGVLGTNSLFAMLATTRTAVGLRALAGLLLGASDLKAAQDRQTAVRELAPQLDLRERVALLGRSRFQQVPAENFTRWVQSETWIEPSTRASTSEVTGASTRPPLSARALRTWRLVFAALFLLTLASAVHAAIFGSTAAWRNTAAVLALQAALSLYLRPRIVAELSAVERLAGQTEVLAAGLDLLREQSFASALLQALQGNAIGEKRALARLESLLTLAEQRTKEWFYLPSMLFAAGTHTALALLAWRRRHGVELLRWLDAWASFEALLALAGYAHEHPQNAWPEFVDAAQKGGTAAVFEARGLVHPLLGRDAVGNDVMLGADTRFLLISGSNMAGKSTLLRTMGATAALAFAGAPVRAESLRLSWMQTAGSLDVADSLAEGRSKFLAEVERLRDVLALARRGPTLFLIDEIFAGTNSADRRIAAHAVLRGMVEAGAIGALSTHDLALTDVESLGGVNVHMASPDPDDPLRFDYRLKPGINRTTNALAIVRMLLGEEMEDDDARWMMRDG